MAMINFSSTASIAPGKTIEARAAANQLAKYIKDRHGTTVEVLVPIGGNPDRVALHGRHESLAQWEAISSKLNADSEFQGMIAKNSSYFLPGTIHQEFWRTI